MPPGEQAPLDAALTQLNEHVARVRALLQEDRAAAASRLAQVESERALAAERMAELEAGYRRLEERLALGEQELAAVQARLAELAAAKEASLAQVAELEAERAALTDERAALTDERAALTAERAALAAERDTVAAERDTVAAERDTVAAERDTVAAERDALAAERLALVERLDGLEQEHAAAGWPAADLPPRLRPLALALHRALEQALLAFDAAEAAARARLPEAPPGPAELAREWAPGLRKVRYLLDTAYYTLAAAGPPAAVALVPAREALAAARRQVAALASDPAPAGPSRPDAAWVPPAPELEHAAAVQAGPDGGPLLNLVALAQQVDAAVNQALVAELSPEIPPLPAEEEEVVRLLGDLWADLYRPNPLPALAGARAALAELLAGAGFRPLEPGNPGGLVRPGYELRGRLIAPPQVAQERGG